MDVVWGTSYGITPSVFPLWWNFSALSGGLTSPAVSSHGGILLQFCDGGIPSILEVWSKAQGQETALFCGFQEWST